MPADHVFIDFNQFVHKVSRSAKSYSMMWKRMYKQLDDILFITNPRQSVYIVMDGPGTLVCKVCSSLLPQNLACLVPFVVCSQV